MAVVTVAPSLDPPVRFQGRVWVKVRPSLREAAVADEQRLADTDYHRNPLLAEIVANLGFAQRLGLGIPLAISALRDNGNP